MKKIIVLLALSSIAFIQQINAQMISGSLFGGVASPKGEIFANDVENRNFGIGLCYSFDLLYHFGKYDEKLGVGLTYDGSAIFGAKVNENVSGGGFYALGLYGLKGSYNLFRGKISPYVSLSTGLSKFHNGGLQLSEENFVEAGYVVSYALGLKPEVGLKLGHLNLGLAYYVPMKYKSYTVNKQTAGALEFYLGYRIGIGLK